MISVKGFILSWLINYTWVSFLSVCPGLCVKQLRKQITRGFGNVTCECPEDCRQVISNTILNNDMGIGEADINCC